jgi:rhamnosyltransferase subunit B
MSRFLLFTKGTAGDIAPFLAIGSELRNRGNSVVLATHCAYRGAANLAGLDFCALDTPSQFESFMEDLPLLHAPHCLGEFFRRHYLPAAERESRIFEKESSNGAVVIARHCSGAAELLEPVKTEGALIRLFTNVAQVKSLPLLGSLFHKSLGDEINQERSRLGLKSVSDWTSWVTRGALLLGGWPSWFCSDQGDDLTNVIPVGFLGADVPMEGRPTEDCNLPTPFAVIVGSTGRPLHESRFYCAAIAGCVASQLPAVLLCRYQHLIPSPLPENIIHYNDLRLSEILPRASVVIHPGGMGTLAHAIMSGVPQLVMPHGGDRPDNATRLERLGVARKLLPSQWNARAVGAELEVLLRSNLIRRNCYDLARRSRRSRLASFASDLIECISAGSPGPITAG